MNFFDIFKGKKRKYEAASQGRRTKGWNTGSGDSNQMIKKDLPWLRERSRDLRRNNPYAHKGIELVTNNVVGKGIKCQFDNDKTGKVSALWKEWTETTACDYEGRNNLAGLQRLIMDAIVESGEVLVRKRYVNDKRFPIQYQVLESDFLDTNLMDGAKAGSSNIIMQGIEFNPDGKRVGYHLYEQHPKSAILTGLSNKSNFIPANEVLHLYRMERPGQIRGVPWLSNCMIRLKDLDGFEDAQLLRAKIASLFVAFIQDISENVECDDESQDLGEKMVPGIIEHLPPGKSIEFANPPAFDLYKDFVNSQLRGIAAGLGVTYEALTQDLSQVNFSSARMGWIEMGRNIDAWRDGIMISGFLNPVQSDFRFMLQLNSINADNITHGYIPPRRELIDPEKEISAMKDAIRLGLDSRQNAVQSMGRDPELVLNQIAEDNKTIDSLGIILDSDPRKTAKSGRMQDSKGSRDDTEN
jgi:lambda family phage portal protein